MDNYINSENSEQRWTPVVTPIYKTATDNITDDCLKSDSQQPQDNDSKSKGRFAVLSPVITLQLIVCLLILILCYVSDAFFKEKFVEIKAYYDSELSASMLFDGKFKDVDYSKLFDE